MKPFHGITQEALVDFLATATDNPDHLTTHEYYEAEAQAVLRLLHLVENRSLERSGLLECRTMSSEDLHELALKSARKYAKSLRKRMP